MANSPAPALALYDGDFDRLLSWTRSTSMRAGLVLRARIVLMASEGVANARIAQALGTTPTSVWKWRSRYAEAGLAGLADAPRSGRPKQLDHAAIISVTLKPPPKKYGVTHWSSRLLADRLGIGNATVARAWREYGVQPWKSETFKFSTDPELVGKVTDVIGLYLAPPENAIVLCVDEKSQIQALDRTAPMLPMRIGDAEKQTHDYKRHGTTTLFAALEVATGQVTSAVRPKHRRQEFLSFLRQIDRAYPEQDLHLVIDNYATHKTPEVKKWLADHPRFHIHFTPTSGSWLNLVEVWFGIIDRQAIRRGIFTSVRDLNAKIRQFVTGWNERKHPFVWTKTPEQVLAKANPQGTSETRH
ncbi:IS630 family transposase [Gulosibacter molinativorax]|uniref:IS630 family transposase n=1 Tax=Gulosibacter molinativorax TaxID=256821 RepID=A0ABT7CAW0_9MICO|nr:IS630 family transposase [Gulosibacter molinativorax]MDJ1372255.1 IS630 family transposase [Gulosibacter molinativorax]